MSYVIGIDIGTESIRSAVFDENGCTLGFGVSENKTQYPRSGWAEQSVHQWENSLVEAVRASISSSCVNPADISAIGVDATSPTVVMLGEDLNPVENAIMWMDLRAVHEAEEISNVDDASLKVVGYGKVSPEWFPCKVLWLKRNRPEVYNKTKYFLDQTDWLTYMLTGELTLNLNSITVRWFYNSKGDGFPEDLYGKLGLADFLDKIPKRIVRPGDTAGVLTGKIAEKTGLKKGIPVAAGGADAYIGVVGVNALIPGKMALITGSSHLLISLVDKEFHAPGINGTFPDAVLEGFQVAEAGQVSTGSVLKWYKDNFLNSKKTVETGSGTYSEMNELAEKIPLGSEGLLVLEHWQGNRTPWVDPQSRGVIRGLTLSHTPAHIYRAIMEGVTYGTAVILSRMEKQGISVNELVVCGGVANSDLWLQIHSDVTGKPISVPEESQAVSLGSAILATKAAGIYKTINEAAESMVRVRKIIEPNLNNTDEYCFYIDQYVKTYEKLKDVSKELTIRSEMNASPRG